MLAEDKISGTGRLAPHRLHGRNAVTAALVLLGITLAYVPLVHAEGISASYLYSLSDFSGTIPFYSTNLFADQLHHEIYTTSSDNVIRIFNDKGMEVYRFNDDGSLGAILDTAVDSNGNILVLTASTQPGIWSLVRCNYRGERIAEIPVTNLPPAFAADFHPYTLVYRPGHIYLVDRGGLRAAVVDEQGNVEQVIDFLSVMKQEEKKRYDFEMAGFAVDKDGNIYYTVPMLFHAFKLTPDGQLTAYGERGGAPGKFNIASGIAVDDRGNSYVVDKLKCAVLIFDKNFIFQTQFGYRGWDRQGLIAPTDIAFMDDKVYITQMGRKGVSVFGITH